MIEDDACRLADFGSVRDLQSHDTKFLFDMEPRNGNSDRKSCSKTRRLHDMEKSRLSTEITAPWTIDFGNTKQDVDFNSKFL
jgi:hypothetical protein